MINNINLGIKIATINLNFIPEIYSNKNIVDFIEIILLPDFNREDIQIIKNLKLPYAIHIPNSNDNIDFGDIKYQINNAEYIERINNIKDDLTPFCYIVHPESGDIELSIKNLKKLKTKPLAIENMPKKSIYGGDLLGYNIKGLKKYFDEIDGLEFCFDINHAIKTSISEKIDYFKFIKDMLIFKKPIIFHLSGGNMDIQVDEHLSLYEGNYNLADIKQILIKYREPVYLTFETPRNYENKIEDDLKNINFFINS